MDKITIIIGTEMHEVMDVKSRNLREVMAEIEDFVIKGFLKSQHTKSPEN